MTGKITGPLREQSDWEQQDENRLGFIKNKPFYDNRKIEEWTLALDASTFKKEDVLGNILLKISDKTMSVEEFGKVRYRVYMDGEMVLEHTGEVIEEGGAYACVGLIMYLEEKQVGLAHVTPGLYLPMSEEDLAEEIEPGRCFYEFYFPSVTTGELKTIDPKYLPSGGGGLPFVEITSAPYPIAERSASSESLYIPVSAEESEQLTNAASQGLPVLIKFNGDLGEDGVLPMCYVFNNMAGMILETTCNSMDLPIAFVELDGTWTMGR